MIRLYAPGDAQADFQCARAPEQSAFWRVGVQQALLYGTATIYVMPGQRQAPIEGFHAICMGRIQTSDLPSDMRIAGLPSALPVGLIAQLARDDRSHKGTGAALLGDAIERIVQSATCIGCAGVALDAKNQSLVTYYEGFGFRAIGTSKGQTRKMFLSIARARASVLAPHP